MLPNNAIIDPSSSWGYYIQLINRQVASPQYQDGGVSWYCLSNEPQRYLPASCTSTDLYHLGHLN